MGKNFPVLFLAIFVLLLVQVFSNDVALCNSQQIIDPQNLLSQSSLENKTEVYLQIGVYEVDLLNLRAEVEISWLEVRIPENRKSESLNIFVSGGGSTTVLCTLSDRAENYTSYSGSSDRMSWLIGGSPELYPFDLYYMTFSVVHNPILRDYTYTFDNSSRAYFEGLKARTLAKTFVTNPGYSPPSTFENRYLPFDNDGKYYPVLQVRLERKILGSVALPLLISIIFAYVFLATSFWIKVPDITSSKKRKEGGLGNRLTIYVALFAFSIGSFFSIQSMVPSPYQPSLIGVLVLNLGICVFLAGIFSILANTFLRNLDLATWIFCVVFTFINLWWPFYDNATLPIRIVLGAPILIFLMLIINKIIKNWNKLLKKMTIN